MSVPNSLQDLLRQLEKSERPTMAFATQREEMDYVTQLEAMHHNMNTTHDFQPGMVLKWKPHLCNRKAPHNGQPVILIRHLEATEQNRSDNDPSSGYFWDIQNAVIGMICPHTGMYREEGVDLRRFMPYEFKRREGLQ